MSPRKKTSPSDYSISYRYKLKNGFEWSECIQGHGQWQSLEFAQCQIKMIVKAHKGKAVEIDFKRKGQRLDFNGNKTEKTIRYEAR